jgi:hypothetical protein
MIEKLVMLINSKNYRKWDAKPQSRKIKILYLWEHKNSLSLAIENLLVKIEGMYFNFTILQPSLIVVTTVSFEM